MYDLAIIGGGPAGVAAGVYASRKELHTIFITEEFGGQSNVSEDIQNWIGTNHVSGTGLAKMLEEHLKEYAGTIVDVKKGVRATKVEKIDGGFRVTTSKEGPYDAKTVILCPGAHRRKLTIPGAAEFEQKGITYCASCDGPVFKGMDVAVIGGGNAGFETAAQLLAYTKSVTLLDGAPQFRADPVTVKKVLATPNMTAIGNVDILEVKGEKMVNAVTFKDKTSGEQKELPVGGVFVEIGLVPSTELVEGFVDLDKIKRIVVDPKNQRTSVEGVWAAGDCTDQLYHQNNIAAGDGVKALEDVYVYLKAR